VDAVYRDAEILTLDPARPRATGMWVRDDRIVALGDGEAIEAMAPPEALVTRLGGSTITPGFIDAHCHVTMLAYLLTGADCSPGAAPSVAAILERLAAQGPGPDGWIVGSGYAEYLLTDGRHPTRAELDGIAPHLPCALFHLSLHLVVVNSAALRELGLDEASPDPPHSTMGRDAAGRLDGRLYEAITLDLVNRNLGRYLAAVDGPGRAAFVRRAADHLAALGVTSTSEAAADASSFLALREAERRGELPIRATVMFKHAEAGWLLRAGMSTGFGSDRLRIGAIKLFCDGGMSSRTAAVDEPYLDPPGETGLLWYEPDGLAAIVRECDGAGFQVAIHAQGERGIRTTLAAYDQVVAPGNPNRHRIEHGGCFSPDLRAVAARLGIHVVVQPAFFAPLGDGYIAAFGQERANGLYPFASFLREGILVAGGSDSPVIGPSPFPALRDAQLRRTNGGAFVGQAEALTAQQALEVYTRNSAFVSGVDDRLGSLEPGKLADFVVLDRDPLTATPESVAETVVRLTVVGGDIAYRGPAHA
jgi:predicted amidohydrolase YtcJ